jgi:hypothetical protein
MDDDERLRKVFPPGTLRSLLGGGTTPLAPDPDEEVVWQRATLPGDSLRIHDLVYTENPYSTKMPSELRALLEDPSVKGEQRRQVQEAFDQLQGLEGGSLR